MYDIYIDIDIQTLEIKRKTSGKSAIIDFAQKI